MTKESSRERILESALTLFSQKGYDGVGIDQIAEAAGMKGPSIYRHFKGKEDILNALLASLEQHYERNFGSSAHPKRIPLSLRELIEMSEEQVRFTMEDPAILKIRRLLAMEQFRSREIAALTSRHYLGGIEGMYEEIFLRMMDRGLLVKLDAHILALEYVAPITLMIHMCDREPLRKEEARKRIREHMKHFVEHYGVKA